MNKSHQYTVEEVLDIALKLSDEDRRKIQEGIQKSLLNQNELIEKINPFHKRFEETYKSLA
jgi:hypothetical protein